MTYNVFGATLNLTLLNSSPVYDDTKHNHYIKMFTLLLGVTLVF